MVALKPGTVSTGDQMVRALWPADHGMPVSRWAVEELRAFEPSLVPRPRMVDGYGDTFCERVLGKARPKVHPDTRNRPGLTPA